MCETLHNNVQYLDSPDRLENDGNSYRLISLNTGLKALLITDPLLDSDFSECNCSDDLKDSIDSKANKNVNSGKNLIEKKTTTKIKQTATIPKTTKDSKIITITTPRTNVKRQTIEANSNRPSKTSSKKDDDINTASSTDSSYKNIATVALLVDVGYFHDPPKIDGLAHLVEHMIFMGSKKYPSESEFDSFIIKSGGNFNGETDCENSFFYFNINDDHLEDALDRFTELFTTPLMLKETMQRECCVIESEFKSKMQNDILRREQILASMANPEHPCSKFGWGNSKTLKEQIDDDILYNAINEFRLRYYSAERMYVCLQADRKMKELQDLVVKYFSKIPKRNFLIEDFSLFNHENAFREEFFENVIFVTPVFDISSLEITWCLPSMIKEYKFKPYEYITYILVHQGCGSLCAYLRRKLWGFEIAAGVEEKISFESNSLYCLFEICIYLTEEGFNHLKDVLEVTFAYIKMIEQHGLDEDLFFELKRLAEMKACTFPETYPNETVFNLKYFPPKDILTAKKLLFDYNPDSIWRIIKILNEQKFNLMITSKKRYEGVKYDKREKWCGTEYGIIKMPPEWLELWKNCKQFSELSFPKENQYILQDSSLLINIDESYEFNEYLYPRKILDIDVCELWFKEEDISYHSKGWMCFHFLTPLIMIHARNELLMELWIVLVKYRLVDQLSAAVQAGYFYDIYISDRGFTLEISSYKDKLYFLTDVITKTMTNIVRDFTENEICLFLKETQDYYKNMLIDPESLNSDIRYGILQKVWWLSIEKYNLIKNINLEQVEAFAMVIFREIHVKAIIQGNINEDDALRFTNLILDNLCCLPIQDPEKIRLKICKLPLGSNFVICKSFNYEDVNTVVTNIYQIGKYTVKTKCILDLITMIVSQPLFDNLRTKEQLAYAVSFDVTFNYGILDYSITVISQEDKFNANYVEQRIEAFRNQMPDIIDKTTQEEYSHFRNSLAKQKLCTENDLSEEIHRYCNEIMYDEYVFDRREKEIDCIRKITKDDVLEFLKRQMEKYRKLSIQVVGHKLSSDFNSNINFSVSNGLHLILDDNSIKDIELFKNGLCVYL